MTISPLIDQLTEKHGFPVVSAESVWSFLKENNQSILFFSGDPVQRAEANDLAVILPELHKTFNGAFNVAVIDRADEAQLKLDMGVLVFPTLVYCKGEEVLGVIPRLKEWGEYVRLLQDFQQQAAA